MEAVTPVIVGAKVDPTLKHQLEDLARSNERTVSQEIRLALRRHVERDVTIESAALAASHAA